MALERKSSIRKVPTADVVDVLTATRPEVDEARVLEPAQVPEDKKDASQQSPPQPRDSNSVAKGPGPGRPRSKRRMEPFSSKIEINLRDELDAYIDENGITIIDFLDEAIRARLKK